MTRSLIKDSIQLWSELYLISARAACYCSTGTLIEEALKRNYEQRPARMLFRMRQFLPIGSDLNLGAFRTRLDDGFVGNQFSVFG